MKKTLETVVFFGSGPVAAESLKRLAKDFEIEAVVTKPRPAHHKYGFPVLEVTKDLGLKTYTPANSHELTQLIETHPFTSRLGIVIDYGIIIGQSVIDYFPLGIVNSHFSLLPKLRGADPISFAILNGDRATGVSLMLIVKGLDKGPLLAQKSLKIGNDATTESLTDDLIKLSHELLVETLPDYINQRITPEPQPELIKPTYTRKLTKQDGQLDWQKPAAVLEREIRAYVTWPRSQTNLGANQVIVTKAHVVPGQASPGKLWQSDKQLGVYTTDGILVIDKLVPLAKKEMSIEAFLAGYKL